MFVPIFVGLGQGTGGHHRGTDDLYRGGYIDGPRRCLRAGVREGLRLGLYPNFETLFLSLVPTAGCSVLYHALQFNRHQKDWILRLSTEVADLYSIP